MKKYLEHDDRKFYIYKMYDKNDDQQLLEDGTKLQWEYYKECE